MKVLPRPGILSTTISPPISRTNWSVMAMPRPEPPNRLAMEASSCWKGRKIELMNLGSMPVPVSFTATIKLTVSSESIIWRKVTEISPWLVNFTALDRKFTSTWVMRSWSPTT